MPIDLMNGKDWQKKIRTKSSDLIKCFKNFNYKAATCFANLDLILAALFL